MLILLLYTVASRRVVEKARYFRPALLWSPGDALGLERAAGLERRRRCEAVRNWVLV